jgi:hypothetical protein
VTHPVAAALASGEAPARRAACEAAANDPSAVLLVDALVGALGDRDPTVVRAAVRALERIGREHDAVLTSLSAALRSEDPHHRLEAAWTWARLEPPPVKLLPAIVSTLEHAGGDARWRAARLLVELGRIHGEVVPVVYGLAASDRPPRVRRIALTALRELAPGSPETLRAHLEASRDPDAGLQRLALTGLAGLRSATSEVWSRLSEVLAKHGDPACRRVAATAVGALGDPPETVKTALARSAASDADASVRAAAERALRQLAAAAPPS